MKAVLKKFIALMILVVLTFSGDALAAPLKKIRAAFTAFAYANPPFWIAKDLCGWRP